MPSRDFSSKRTVCGIHCVRGPGRVKIASSMACTSIQMVISCLDSSIEIVDKEMSMHPSVTLHVSGKVEVMINWVSTSDNPMEFSVEDVAFITVGSSA